MQFKDGLLTAMSLGLIFSGTANFALGITCAGYRQLVSQLKADQHPILRLNVSIPEKVKPPSKFDPDEYDHCLYSEKIYHDWMKSEQFDSPGKVEGWKALVLKFPKDMRDAARKELGYK